MAREAPHPPRVPGRVSAHREIGGPRDRPTWPGRDAAGLPLPPIRSAIAEATHGAVAVWAEADGFAASRACLPYAVIATRVASEVTGRRYATTVGSIRVPIDANGGAVQVIAGPAPTHPAADPASPRCHAWVVAVDGDRGELLDVSIRHAAAWAASAGTSWELPEPPAYLWELVAVGVPGLVAGVAYGADAELTRRVLRWWWSDPTRVAVAAALAVEAAAEAARLLRGARRP